VPRDISRRACASSQTFLGIDPLRGKRQTWLYRVAFYRTTAYLNSARYRHERLAGTHPGNVFASMVQKGDPEKHSGPPSCGGFACGKA
jgi:hypothetical protein